MTVLPFLPIMKSLSVDFNEQYIFIASHMNPLNVVRLITSTGSIFDAQMFSSLDGQFYGVRIHILSDSSGYYVSGYDSILRPNICKYQFSSPTTAQCQQITSFAAYAIGQLLISDNSIFTLGFDPSTFDLHIYLLSFTSTSPTWANKML